MEILYEIFKDQPRQGPGDNESTRKAFKLLSDLPKNPRILDFGCGSGTQTLQLAKLTDGKIIALDIFQGFLDRLKEKAEKEGVSEKIETVRGQMESMNFEERSFDVIWSEGAIFIVGFEQGLREWRRFLKNRGYIVVSEVVWLKSNPPEELRNFWMSEYPEIKTIRQDLKIIQDLGYELIGHFIIPTRAWELFYEPLEKRIKSLREEHENDQEAEAKKVLDATKKEIEIFRKFSDYYGYCFFVIRS